MATGKGIVASNVGQLGQLLKHEQDALLVGQRTKTSLRRRSSDCCGAGLAGAAGSRRSTEGCGELHLAGKLSSSDQSRAAIEAGEERVCSCRFERA